MHWLRSINKHALNPPRLRDFWLLGVVTVLITLQPFFLHGEINLFELGLYLPGIDGILKGMIPFRDFFHLRGPLELYVPALFMKIFGENVAALEACFYLGNIVLMVAWVLVGQRLYSTRLIYYLMTLVFIGRTFPRVTFDYWGGFRYAWGAMAVLLAVNFFKQGNKWQLFWAGVFSVLGLLASVEIGVCALAGVVGAVAFSYFFRVHDRRKLREGFGFYLLGCLVVLTPFVFYFGSHQALWAFGEAIGTVVTRMQTVINVQYVDTIPSRPLDILAIMFNPAHKNFRHVTPVYLYLFLALYLLRRIRRQHVSATDVSLVCIGIYGGVMYNAAFRLIWASQFEMALQPEKILLFFLLERIFLVLDGKKMYHLLRLEFGSESFKDKFKIYAIRFLILALVMSSVLFAVQRFNKRFFAYKWMKETLLGRDPQRLIPLYGQERRTLHLKRIRGMTVPAWQAEDCERLAEFFEKNTALGETVFMFPELGAYHFIVDRPFVGRFPMATFTWFQEAWHEEFMDDLKRAAPAYAVYQKDLGPTFPQVYFQIPANKAKFDEVLNFLESNYAVVAETPSLWIYKRK